MTYVPVLSWLHVGDLHVTTADQDNYRHLTELVEVANRHLAGAVDFALLPGDNADQGTEAQFRLVRAAIDRLALPVRILPGDHDFHGRTLDGFHAVLGARPLPLAETVAGHRCLFLDVVSAGGGGPDFRLDTRQLDWLQAALEDAAASGEPPVVFMHTYPSDLREGAERLRELLARHRVACVDMGQRGLIVAALVVLAIGALVIFAWPTFWPVLVANTATAVVGDVFGPAVAALTLGLYARAALARRLGRNSAFDHAGNVAIAAAAGGVGYLFSQRAAFLLVPVCAVLATLATLSIPASAIDHERARGADGHADDDGGAPHGLRVLLGNRPLLVFAVCALLFHFANAPLLPLVGQKLAAANREWATAMMSACIIAAQVIMLPIALAVGHYADRVGRKPILLVGFAVLPVRALLYLVSDDPAWLIGVQLLDGVGAGIFGAITPLLIADLTRGTGRYNVAQGAVATVQGIGASLSGLAVGLIVDRFGYPAAFLESAAAAGVALAALLFAMPETAQVRGEGGDGRIIRSGTPRRT